MQCKIGSLGVYMYTFEYIMAFFWLPVFLWHVTSGKFRVESLKGYYNLKSFLDEIH